MRVSLVLVLLSVSCAKAPRHGRAPTSEVAPAASSTATAAGGSWRAQTGRLADDGLPEVPGFRADAAQISKAEAYVRRTYVRGDAHVQVTLARMSANRSAADYQRWREGSAAFPQADLGLPPSMANGFYQCTDAALTNCDLLIQLRNGWHLELRGGGTSSRTDVDDLARSLPLGSWAAGP